MLRIAICDDDPVIREKLYELSCRVLFKYSELDFCYYRNGNEVIAAIDNNGFQAELLLLDINMPGRDGIYVADYIRRNAVDVDIIFVTVSNSHVFQGYQYKAFAYCMKPIDETQLSDVIVRYVKEKQKRSYCINVSVNGQNIRIQLNRVAFFESQKRKIIAHELGGDIIFYGKMGDLESVLPNDKFFRCHQSYIVNRDMIDAVKRTEIVVGGVTIPMSRKYYEMMNNTSAGTTAGNMPQGPHEYSPQDSIRTDVLPQTEDITKSLVVTKSMAMNSNEKGAIVFVGGKLIGTIIRMNDLQKVIIGRDASQVNVVIDTDTVSRKHCEITYNGFSNTYTVYDMSKNGVFLGSNQRLAKETMIDLKPGAELWIGDEINRIRLG